MRNWLSNTYQRYTSTKKHSPAADTANKQTLTPSPPARTPPSELLPGRLGPMILEYEFLCEGEHVNSRDLGTLISLYTVPSPLPSKPSSTTLPSAAASTISTSNACAPSSSKIQSTTSSEGSRSHWPKRKNKLCKRYANPS
jgi:hypothetical protein